MIRTQQPKKRSRAARLNPAERRAQLMACALKVFAREGLGGGRHADIAAEAGVAVPTVFVYFPSREALLDAVLETVADFIVEDVVAPVQTLPVPAPDRLLATALAFAESIDTHPDHGRVWLDWSTSIRDGVWPRYLHFQSRVIAMLRATVEAGQRTGTLRPEIDAGNAARLVVGSAHMIALMKFAHSGEAEIRDFVRSLIDGFRPPRPG